MRASVLRVFMANLRMRPLAAMVARPAQKGTTVCRQRVRRFLRFPSVRVWANTCRLDASAPRAARQCVPRGTITGAGSMAFTSASICDFGWKARDFSLTGVDGKTYSLADIRGPKRTLVVL